MKQWSRFLALATVLVLAEACASQDGPTTPDLTPRAEQLITCHASIGTRSLNCDSPELNPSNGLNLNVMLGGQNTYVTLAGSGITYTGGTGAWSATVTVQNRTVQPMGTSDGIAADAEGVRVFLHTGPTPTGGTTGAITIDNEDGTATFTGAGQPYWQYNQVLAPGATSTGKAWTFTIGGDRTGFTFTALVSAKLPHDAGVLKWNAIAHGQGTEDLAGVVTRSNGGVTSLWAVGAAGKIIHYNGTVWSTQASGHTIPAFHGIDIHGDGGAGLVGVIVGDSGTILYTTNGTSWADATGRPGGLATLMSVSRLGDGPSYKWVACGKGGIVYSTTVANGGSGWAAETSNTAEDLNFCGGPATDDVYAVGGAGTIDHWNGTAWSTAGYTSNTTQPLRAATGAETTGTLSDIWIAGDNGTIHHDGSAPFTTFTAQTLNCNPSCATYAVYGMQTGSSNTDVYAVGAGGSEGLILHRNANGTWSQQASGTSNFLQSVSVVSSSPVEVWVVGNGGTVLKGTR